MVDLNQSLAVKLRLAIGELRNLPRVLRLVWRASPGWTSVWACGLVIQAFPPVAIVFLTRILVDQLSQLVQGDPNATPNVVLPVAMIVGVMLAGELLRSILEYVASVQATILQDHIHSLVHEQAARVDMSFYDLPEYFDHLHRAQSEAWHRPSALLLSLGGLMQQGITLLAMCIILLRYGWSVPLVLGLTTIPSLWVLLRYTYRQHQFRTQTTSDERHAHYYSYLLTGRECASELRLFDLGPAFRSKFDAIRLRLRVGERSLAREHMFATSAAAMSAVLLAGSITLWMVWQTHRGLMTLGELAFFYQAFSQGQKMTHAMFQQAGQVYYNSLFAGDLFDYLNLKPEIVSPKIPHPCSTAIEKGIQFEGVTFCYPRSNSPIIRDLNLRLPAGKMVALVGQNGAGKSTLIKLLLRFYDPSDGRITLDGIDLKQFSLTEYRKLITVLFQQPVPYNTTVRENLTWGIYPRNPDQEEIETAARQAGLQEIVARLPNGYDQLLGKWFLNGEELSVGQWQRVALGRAFLRQAPFIILDEPTSAMDPWAEAEWLAGFRKLAKSKTVLIITHRFSTAMHADEIHVMEGGQIIESGTHDSLVHSAGRYAAGYRAQSLVKP